MTARPRYRVLFDLAEGGMGVVSVGLLQSDRGFQRVVALKRIHREVADDESARRALLREAHLASLIRDPGIVQIHELVEQDAELLVAMELVEGVSLRTLLEALEAQRRRLPISIATRVLLKCADALDAAHEATDTTTGAPLGVVHRDVSPHNVLVSFRGEVKLTDFGIAKAMEESGESTKPGMLRGKPAYVAPEQISSSPVDARTDIWSLGVVGHELFTGSRLFRGRTDAETIDQLMHAEIPPLDAVRSDVPPAVAAVIARALQRDPSQRWPSAHAMARALEDAAGPSSARREDVAELLASVLGDEQRRFTERLRRAMAEPRADVPRRGADDASERRRPRLRFFGLMAAGFAAVAALRLATLGPGSSANERNEASVTRPRSEDAPSSPAIAPTERRALDTPAVAVPGGSLGAGSVQAASRASESPPTAVVPVEVPARGATSGAGSPEITDRTPVRPVHARPPRVAAPPRVSTGAGATTPPPVPSAPPDSRPATPRGTTGPAPGAGARPTWMEFPL